MAERSRSPIRAVRMPGGRVLWSFAAEPARVPPPAPPQGAQVVGFYADWFVQTGFVRIPVWRRAWSEPPPLLDR